MQTRHVHWRSDAGPLHSVSEDPAGSEAHVNNGQNRFRVTLYLPFVDYVREIASYFDLTLTVKMVCVFENWLRTCGVIGTH